MTLFCIVDNEKDFIVFILLGSEFAHLLKMLIFRAGICNIDTL